MHDFDLIPQDYRAWLWRRRFVVRMVWLQLLLAALVAAVSLGLGWQSRQMEQRLEALQAQRNISDLQRTQLLELGKVHQQLQQQARFLEGLRSGIAATDLLQAIDRALVDEGVWFMRWSFQRDGSLVEQAAPQAGDTGYFIVVPSQTSPQDSQRQVMQFHTRMSVKGQALDHATLSAFIRRLLEQPQVTDAYLKRTSVRQYTASQVVDFDLEVMVSSKVAG
ncbi:PilN domain-containing protein [Pseudomonas benzenivorans]|uniref:PilN domain-containing protein n=1 Tax=Pseudomonas benzenivorans TaxID=556533 RepID=A0ABY5H5R3_9PSED|nr:PilN domain-containing protein [Pseudomonas benzenivorans]UTW07136.1 PilN domain-containing protein [Pseudomonas benzenivorans]